VRRALSAAMLALAACGAAAQAPLPPFAPGGPVAIRNVGDDAALELADGRKLVLVGIDIAMAPRALADRARKALEKLVAAKPLEIRYAGAPVDRHGWVMAELFAGGVWVERDLVWRGLARVRGSADERLGLAELLAAEAEARRARRGLWRERRYAVRESQDAARDAGTWQIVEGKVVHVADTSEGIAIEFDGLRAFVPRPQVPLMRAAGLEPKTLDGARLRVRGFIDGTRRPEIAVTFPEQIERP
jgi:micrococcal nuclease